MVFLYEMQRFLHRPHYFNRYLSVPSIDIARGSKLRFASRQREHRIIRTLIVSKYFVTPRSKKCSRTRMA